MTVLSEILSSRIWEAISAIVTLANFGFLIFYVWQLYLRRLRFELYIDNWAEVRNRCCDPKCQNPHVDFKCTLVAIGPKEKVTALTLEKTEFKCPSGLKVEVSPNNHKTPTGEFWGRHTPLVICGGEKIVFTVSYKPELDHLNVGDHEVSVCLRARNGKLVRSSTERLNVSAEKQKELAASLCHVPLSIELVEHA